MDHVRPFERFATVDGRRTRYLEAGTGRPLVLIHAFPLSADMWVPQLEGPPAGWRLIAPDLRGLGQSARVAAGEPATAAGARSVDGHAVDVLALLDHLGLERVVVAGLSMGGYVAFAIARQAPARVAALVLCDTRPQADSEEVRAGRRALMTDLKENGVGAVAAAMIVKLLGPTALRRRPGPADEVRRIISGNDPAGIAEAIYCLMTRPDSTAQLPRIACPTLIVAGEEDQLTPVEVHQEMHRAIAGSELVVIPQAGHLSSFERPVAFNAALRQFLAKLPA